MRVARALALCAKAGGLSALRSDLQQLSVTGSFGFNGLRCLSATLTAQTQSTPPQLSATAQLLQQMPGSRQYASVGAQVAESGADSGSDAESEQQQQVLLTPEQYRRQYQMWVDAKDAPAPVQTFQQADLPDRLLQGLLRHGFTAPTFIQAQAWPIARQRRDLVAIASTGSGKTAGFLMPAFIHILEQQQQLEQHSQKHQQQQGGQLQQRQQGSRGVWGSGKWSSKQGWGGEVHPPFALVLAPTRELAQQIQVEADRLGSFMRIRNACLYGGASRGPQGRAISRGPQIVIATPGRLLDFVNSGELNVNRVSMLILDEADRMLDMGFEPQIRELLEFMPGGSQAVPLKPDDLPVPPRQTLFFSATWPKEVQSIARQLCRNDPVRVFVGNVQERLVANKDVTQLVALLGSDEDRLPALQEYIHEHLHGAEMAGAAGKIGRDVVDEKKPRVVVFAETKRDCDKLARQLSLNGVRAVAVHGDKAQRERDDAIHAFRAGRVPVLVATDVAARGLDIPGVTAVVNYSFPVDHDMYVHRIGRTGRAGRKGESLTLLTPQDAAVTPVLVQIMQDAGQEVPAELEAVAARVRKPAQNKHRYGSSAGNNRGKDWRGGNRRGRDQYSSGGRYGGRYGGRGGERGGNTRDAGPWGSSRGDRRATATAAGW